MDKIVIIGSGGHAKVIIDIILKRKEILNEKIEIMGIVDDKFFKDEKRELFGFPIIGKINEILKMSKDIRYIIAIGNNAIREKISTYYSKLNFITLIHPEAVIGRKVEIEEGTVIMAKVVVNSYSKIGKHCILNTGCIIEHDNLIGNYVHISPSATLCGGVEVGKGTWIGAGATVIQEIKIEKEVVVGAGTVVLENIKESSKIVGAPGKRIK